ncbi:SRPBCC family protein [Thermomonospora umbrina]|uniref:Uncharacterized protein YndB with AHSA1/START domain n=1 Tax=Thermomonospora umbrina TaxID=111806 RepID=A0A3D9SNZ4_9ACTN|nr:SRPBCC domain-containing protein [Thermomonospora umbrina]REE97696.1 uncharacterized protein YndB with AHSA1/START domain [Thermomonospora umbrina]
MPHEFEVREEIELAATPEEVWEAIATGPGVDSWFMGRNQIEPRVGGRNLWETPLFSAESTVTAYDPPHHYAYRSDEAPDGQFMAFEYLVEGREGGSSVLRFVHSGFLGDDWEEEYDAIKKGDRQYLNKLAVYLKHFKGRTSLHNLFLVGPQVADEQRVWSAFKDAFGLTGDVAPGDKGRLAVEGLAPMDAVVEFEAAPHFLGVRAGDGISMLIYGHESTVVVERHEFSADADGKELEGAWQSWFTAAFGN